MQIKRDTEYALRILFAMGERCPEKDGPMTGLSINEITMSSGVPRVGVDRLCRRMASAGLITERKGGGGELLFCSSQDMRRATLLDVMKITEDGISLFAVFEKNSPFYRSAGIKLQGLQEETEALLSCLTVGDLLNAEKNEKSPEDVSDA